MSTLYGIKKGHYYGTEFSFRDGTYSSLKSFDINFLNLPVYRADTKQEFVMDAFLLVGSFVTGGTYGGLKFAFSKIESDS
jgi:hypothetical protein